MPTTNMTKYGISEKEKLNGKFIIFDNPKLPNIDITNNWMLAIPKANKEITKE